MKPMYNDLLGKIDRLTVASCSCFVKTPDIEFHKENCKYRMISEIRQEVEKLIQQIEKPNNK